MRFKSSQCVVEKIPIGRPSARLTGCPIQEFRAQSARRSALKCHREFNYPAGCEDGAGAARTLWSWRKPQFEQARTQIDATGGRAGRCGVRCGRLRPGCRRRGLSRRWPRVSRCSCFNRLRGGGILSALLLDSQRIRGPAHCGGAKEHRCKDNHEPGHDRKGVCIYQANRHGKSTSAITNLNEPSSIREWGS